MLGYASKEVMPDEIYIRISLVEKYNRNEKITIEMQEQKLKEMLKNLEIDLSYLTLSDASAGTVKIKWRTTDILTSKNYTLQVGDAKTVGKVFQELDKIDIKNAYIERLKYSKMDSLKKAINIEAIKDAKNKADYLLNAIGENTGKPLFIEEYKSNNTNSDMVSFRGARSGSTAYYIDGVRVVGKTEKEIEPEIEFQKFKIESYIYVKFAIQ